MIYQITSTSWTGYIDAEYNDLGYLVHYDLRTANLSEAQQVFFLKHMPRELAELETMIKGSNAVITEIKRTVTFDEAWKLFHDEFGSKKKAQAKWNKMPEAETLKAFDFIKKYLAKKPENIAKMYFVTYLNAELWNN